MTKTMTITVSEDLGMALVAAGAAAAGDQAAQIQDNENLHDGFNMALVESNKSESRSDVQQIIHEMENLAGQKALTSEGFLTIVGADGIARKVSTTPHAFGASGYEAVLMHLVGEEPSDDTRYVTVPGRQRDAVHVVSEKVVAALTRFPLPKILKEALKRERPAKRAFNVLIEDNGCEVTTTDRDGKAIRLIRYETTNEVVYATGPLSTMPLIGMSTELMAHDLGHIWEKGKKRRALLCDPGNAGHLVKWEPNGSGWRR